MGKLQKKFYRRADVNQVAKELLGKVLVTRRAGKLTSGMIVETEAYRAPEDAASHAYQNRRTARTEVMFAAGGLAYVYLIYGMYELFNVVTHKRDRPHVVLIRALQPLEGLEVMRDRRKAGSDARKKLTQGPGLLSQALGITCADSGADLRGASIWVEDRGFAPAAAGIQESPRIGLGVGEPYRSVPWRYSIRASPWVSDPKPSS